MGLAKSTQYLFESAATSFSHAGFHLIFFAPTGRSASSFRSKQIRYIPLVHAPIRYPQSLKKNGTHYV